MSSKRKGISLIELILTISLISIVLQIVYSIFFVSDFSYSISRNKGFSQQEVRIVGNFIENELRYVTDINLTDEYLGEYYSLRILEDDNSKNLIKTKHTKTLEGEIVSQVDEIEQSILGSWKSIKIKNSVPGEISIDILQEEGKGKKKAGYNLPISIKTFNNDELLKIFSDIDLMSGSILYYRNTSADLLNKGIDIDYDDSGLDDDAEYVVAFYNGDLTPIESYKGTPNTTIDVPAELVKTGDVFLGWYDDKGNKYTGEILIPNYNLYIYAKWESESIPQMVSIGEITKIDGQQPKTSGSKYIINKGKDGSIVQIKLQNYSTEFKNIVISTADASNIPINSEGFFSFKAATGNSGKGSTLTVKITLKQSGYSDQTKEFSFISNP